MDIREFLFAPTKHRCFRFQITVWDKGVLSGVERVRQQAAELTLTVEDAAAEGERLEPGSCVLRGRGSAQAIIKAEEMLLASVGKPSGVATAAATFVGEARGRIKVVCGAWKKVDVALRSCLRQAVLTGGVEIRISDRPFIYLDKNYVRILGGIRDAVTRARQYDAAREIAVQLRGESQSIDIEAAVAVECGASILMVDTGDLGDLEQAAKTLRDMGKKDNVRLAFAGGVVPEKLAEIADAGADIVDVGRAIVDAPMLDVKLDVIE